MHNYSQAPTQPANLLSQQEFLSRVGQLRNEIRTLSTDVQRISQLHQAALSGSDDSAQRRLDELVASTQHKNNGIRGQLRTLKGDVEATPLNSSSATTKKGQWEVLNREFQKELQAYLQEEQSFKERYRDQIARQYRIVNPNAGEDEVGRAAEMDWGNEGVFQTAVGDQSTLVWDERNRTDFVPCSSAATALAKPMQCWATCARDTMSLSTSSARSTSWST